MKSLPVLSAALFITASLFLTACSDSAGLDGIRESMRVSGSASTVFSTGRTTNSRSASAVHTGLSF